MSAELDSISLLELEEALECVICLCLPPSTPISQCDNGHLFCSNCRSRLTKCPICRIRLGMTRSLIAEKMLDKIPVRCPYAQIGCRVKISRKDVENHSQECQMREVSCPSRLCKMRVRFDALVKQHKFQDLVYIFGLSGFWVIFALLTLVAEIFHN